MSDTAADACPVIIQGGMGVAVSNWQLARAVSQTGQLGVVSGTAIDAVLARRLQVGDPGAHMRRALAAFPYPDMAARVLDRYFMPGGKPDQGPFIPTPVLGVEPTQEQMELVVVANFVEVFLAKCDHNRAVGINYLEKIQTPTLPSLFGAMLAGVEYVLMGAGIPRAIPGILDRLANSAPVELPLNVAGASRADNFVTQFDPKRFAGGSFPRLKRPKFIAIVASITLANMLARKATGRVDGFIVEGPTAGGHNAPPRGDVTVNARGEPVYGERDVVDLDAIAALGRRFWLAGSYSVPEQVAAALASGASGVQVGTPFAFCEESGLRDDIKTRVLNMCRAGETDIVTDRLASPTGFPFKVLRLEGSLSENTVYQRRKRVCDLGFLRQAYRKEDGTLGWRCPGEHSASYVHKGGKLGDTHGRKCICNGLMANIGFGQTRHDGEFEPPLVTCGYDVRSISRLLKTSGDATYSATDVVDFLMSDVGHPIGAGE